MDEGETIENTNSSPLYKLLRLKRLVKANGLCLCCVNLYGIHRGENRTHRPQRSWKRHRRTQYKAMGA